MRCFAIRMATCRLPPGAQQMAIRIEPRPARPLDNKPLPPACQRLGLLPDSRSAKRTPACQLSSGGRQQHQRMFRQTRWHQSARQPEPVQSMIGRYSQRPARCVVISHDLLMRCQRLDRVAVPAACACDGRLDAAESLRIGNHFLRQCCYRDTSSLCLGV